MQDAVETTGEFSAEKFVEDLLTNGEIAKCDKSAPGFERKLIPDYYDSDLYKTGQRFFHKNLAAMILSKLLGLLAIGAQNTATPILVMTRKSSSDVTAYRRYVATLFHVLIWYSDDLSPNSRLTKSLLKIRRMHTAASETASRTLSYRISQKDMALTQFGFMGFAVTRAKILGIHNATYEELRGVIHLWRVVGYVLGMDEQFNICKDSVKDTRAICEELIDKLLGPASKQRDPLYMEMSAYVVNGLAAVIPVIEHNFFLFLTTIVLDNDITKASHKNLEFDKLTIREQRKVEGILVLLGWFQYDVIRIFVNYVLLFAFFLTKYFPILAIIKYGWNHAFVRI